MVTLPYLYHQLQLLWLPHLYDQLPWLHYQIYITSYYGYITTFISPVQLPWLHYHIYVTSYYGYHIYITSYHGYITILMIHFHMNVIHFGVLWLLVFSLSIFIGLVLPLAIIDYAIIW